MGIRLGKICRFQSGGTPAKSNPEYFNGTIPWITTVSLNGAKICEDDAVEWITEKAIKESAAKIVPAYSIMVGTRVGVGKVAVNTVPMSTSQDIISLLGIDETKWHKDFLCKYIQGKSAFLNSQARGATIRGIKIDVLSNLTLPDVSIEEQIHISQVIDNVRSIISDRQQELEKLDNLIKARFVELFGKSDYPKEELINVIIDGAGLSYGIVQPGEDGTGDMGVLRPVDLIDGKVSTSAIKYIDRSIGEGYKKTELTGDELLITVRGTTGITALTDHRFDRMNVTRGIAVIRYDRDKINPVYLNSYLKMDESQRYIQEHTRGATLQQINLSDLRVQKILMPPRALQDEFSEFAKQVDKSKFVVQKALDEVQLLFDSLMQQYFG